MITIIDYGVGNVGTIINVYKKLGIQVKIAKNKLDLQGSSKIILPGVGSFDFVLENLYSSRMMSDLEELIIIKKLPILGLCVGMQIFAKFSEEGKCPGFGLVDAHIKKFKCDGVLPHMGWNEVSHNGSSLFKNIEPKARFYFLHSYYIECNNQNNIIATSEYMDFEFVAAIQKDNIYAVQFHPEKSHDVGTILLKNFAEI